jgi:DNA-directed RNA polymerase subunit RPC12/RpoP
MDCLKTLSQEEDGNPEIEYERCPHCSRQFFKGKLQLHLGLCSADNPMLITPLKVPLAPLKPQKTKSLYNSREQACPRCHAKLPNFLLQSHFSKCPPQEGSS